MLRKLAINQQVADLRKRGVFGELFDGIAAIPENPLFAVDERDGALARTGVSESRIESNDAGLRTQAGDIDSDFSFCAGHDREFIVLPVQTEFGTFHTPDPSPDVAE
jgi:hypothetical protein